MRSGLLFKLIYRKPNILLNNTSLFGYTFLQSECLDDLLKADANNKDNIPIIELLKKPFTVNDVLNSPFLKNKYHQHQENTEKCLYSLNKEKHRIAQNVDEASYKNILDLNIWRKIFAEVLDLRYDELQHHPQIDTIFKHMETFFSRFDIKNSKFYLDKSELPKLFTLKENCTNIFDKKTKLGNIKLQTAMINFFTKASSKVPVHLQKMRKYYQTNLINKLDQILQKQNNVVDLARLQTVLDALYLANQDTRSIFTKKIKQIMQKTQNFDNYDPRDCLVIATNWSCLGEMKPQYSSIFNKIFDTLLVDSPAALLQSIVTCHRETPELIDRLLSTLQEKPFDLLSRKPQIHRVFHILAIRKYDLSKFSNLINRICKQNCDKLDTKISQAIKKPIYSQCMKPDLFGDVTYYFPSLQQKWVSNILKNEFFSKKMTFAQTKICRFDVLFGFIKDGKVYVLQIPNLNKVINKPKNYRGTILQKQQMFSYYGVHKIQLDVPDKVLQNIIFKKDKQTLIKEVKLLIQTI